MLPVIVYIVGCFLGGLATRSGRFLPWIVSGAAALLCAFYLMYEEVPLPGLSISSLSVGETEVASNPAAPVAEIRGIKPSGSGGILRVAGAIVSPAFARVRSLGENATAARLGLVLFLAGAAAALARPRVGLYLILFCALVADPLLLPWFPFLKGFSSRESLFFVHDAFIASPLELYLVIVAVAWWVRRRSRAEPRFHAGALFWPALAFAASLLFGIAYGLATGGDPRIALWEARAPFYLVPLLFLTGNLVETPGQIARLFSIASVALFLKGIEASLHYFVVLRGDLSGVESIGLHSTAVHLNVLFVAGAAWWLYGVSGPKRFLLPAAIPFAVPGYLAMQRRSAVVTLGIAFFLAGAVLYRERRRTFWKIVPVFLLLSAVYVGAGWNSRSVLAVPVRALKSVYAAQRASERDQRSNNYRVRENRNISFTIHRHPWTGIGFGHKFAMVVPLEDIGRFFEWWEYITHNSILWIWMKAGLVGFFSLACLIGLAVSGAAGALGRPGCGETKAIVLTAGLYTVMHFIYACVDMSWDAASTVFVGAMMGVVNRAGRSEPSRP